MTSITVITREDGDVEAHATGCRDIARKTRSIFADSFEIDAASEHEVFMDYNADFIAEGGEDNAYPIVFLPCCKLPKG